MVQNILRSVSSNQSVKPEQTGSQDAQEGGRHTDVPEAVHSTWPISPSGHYRANFPSARAYESNEPNEAGLGQPRP